MQYFPTDHIAEVGNYPYGRLRTTAFFGTEFKHGKGFRSTFQTINPTTGRVNAIKKQVYYPISLMYQDEETGYFKHKVFNPSGNEEVNKALDFVCEHHGLFTTKELEFIATYLAQIAKAGVHAIVIYCGAGKERAFETGKPAILGLIQCIKEPTLENFKAVRIDCAALDALKVEGYNPFTLKGYEVIGS